MSTPPTGPATSPPTGPPQGPTETPPKAGAKSPKKNREVSPGQHRQRLRHGAANTLPEPPAPAKPAEASILPFTLRSSWSGLAPASIPRFVGSAVYRSTYSLDSAELWRPDAACCAVG
jgi:hypothetical protein